MKNIEELSQEIYTIKEHIQTHKDFNASIYAFYPKYDNKTDTILYPSYALFFKIPEIQDYCTTLLDNARAKIDKTTEIKSFDYSNSKTTIDYLNLNDTSDFVNNIKHCINNIRNSKTENFNQIKKHCNCLVIQICDSKLGNIFFFMKGTPFVKQEKFLFLLDEEKNITKVQYNLNLPLSLTTLIIQNDIYLLNNGMDTIFGFENALKMQKEEAIQKIQDTNILDEENFKIFNQYCSKGKTYYKFSNFDNRKLDAIKNNKANKILDRFQIHTNEQGKIILNTDEQAKILCKFLCNDLKVDCIDDDLLYDSPGNTII